MNVLGVSAYVHDSAACLVCDGEIVANVEEERFDRRKHSGTFPQHAISYVLGAGGVDASQIDLVAFNWDPYLSLLEECKKAIFIPLVYRKILRYNDPPKNFSTIFSSFRLRKALRQHLGEDFRAPIEWVPHHLAHAASTYFLSSFNYADILVVDGHGENCSTSFFRAQQEFIRQEWKLPVLSSLGILYRNITRFLGFAEYQEGTTMALAALGQDRVRSFFDQAVHTDKQGRMRIGGRYAGWWYYEGGCYEEQLGPLRRNGEPLEQRHMDIAASLQAKTKDSILKILTNCARDSDSDNLCLAGGVFLNCDINRAIVDRGLYRNIFIPPFTSDAGGAAGAALAGARLAKPPLGNSSKGLFSPYQGPSYTPGEIETSLQRYGLSHRRSEAIWEDAADALAGEMIVGWFQGRAESGPRALGNRSILASPFREATKRRINAEIKKREFFRPFSPVITEEAARKFFCMPEPFPSMVNYMLLTVQVREAYQELLPGVLHVDGSARVQVVTPESNRRLFDLLEAFERRTGFAVLLNTSFNLHEPIVLTPDHAVDTFLRAGLDALFIGDFAVASAG